MRHGHSACPQCDATLSPGAGFCHRCGAQTLAPWAGRHRIAWIAAGVLVVLSLLLTLHAGRGPEPAIPDMAGAPLGLGVAAPDISALSPRERFDRLFDRVMIAAEQGDTATVFSFTDHAMFAYAQLDSVDADARYHAAVLAIQIGRYEVALAFADTILTVAPDHLFGFVIRGTVGDLAGDAALLFKAREDFLGVWSPSAESSRAEYQDHRPILEDFRLKAEASRPPGQGS